MDIKKISDLAVKHDYYASNSNYFSNTAAEKYRNWWSFYSHYKDADIDLNLVYRWDVFKNDEDDTYYMQIIQIRQRFGIYAPIYINKVTDDDVAQIIDYLRNHFTKLKSIWHPLSL